MILRLITLTLLTSGCAMVTPIPNEFFHYVEIIDGTYKGQLGQVIGECPGVDVYKVYIYPEEICEYGRNIRRIEPLPSTK